MTLPTVAAAGGVTAGDIEYHDRRLRQERHRAAACADPLARASHWRLAQAHQARLIAASLTGAGQCDDVP